MPLMIANAHDLVPNPWRICTCPPVTHGPWGKRSAMWNKLLCGTRCSFEVPGASWNRNMPCTHSLARIVSLGWFWMVLAHVFLGLTIPCKGITLLKVASSACGHMSVFVYSVVPTPPFQQTCQCPTNQMIYCELQGGKLEWHCSFAYVNSQESRIFVSGGRFFHVFFIKWGIFHIALWPGNRGSGCQALRLLTSLWGGEDLGCAHSSSDLDTEILTKVRQVVFASICFWICFVTAPLIFIIWRKEGAPRALELCLTHRAESRKAVIYLT